MVVRRRYKTPQGFRDGGRVPLSADGPETTASADVTPPESPVDDDALLRAVEAARRAEELQRQPTTLEGYVASLPISGHKKKFILSNPQVLGEAESEAMRAVYAEALDAGIADDSSAMDSYILGGVRQKMEQRRQQQVEQARAASAMEAPLMPEPDIPLAAERLANEAGSYLHMMQAVDASPASAASRIAGSMATARSMQPRRMPMVAPPSREVPTASGRHLSDRQITLTAEERIVARNSFSAPNMTDAQKEFLYAQNKRKLMALRAAGEYPEAERN